MKNLVLPQNLNTMNFVKLLTISACFLGIANVNGQNDSLSKKIDHVAKDVEILKNLKITGWVQAQYQWASRDGAKNYDGGDFGAYSSNRFMIRRGRVKFTYNQKLTQFVMQLNGTERGINLVEIYGVIRDPWTKSFALTAGVMNRPFGFEIQQSSAVRETPERSRFVQVLLPNERDLGAMLTYQPVKGSKLFGLKVDAGFYNGTGISVPGTSLNGPGVVDFDDYKDFISRIYYNRTTKSEKITFGIGTSYYNGGFIRQNNVLDDEIRTDAAGIKYWASHDTTTSGFKGTKAPRIYYDVEAQFSINTKLGKTTLRGEYIFGQQSGTQKVSNSPRTLPSETSSYLRNFDGAYAYLIQRIGKTKHEIALKYEWYDPNTDLSSKDFVVGTTMKDAEIRYDMLGVGYSYYWDENVKFMLYYNMVRNEHAAGISGYNVDVKDDIFTVRVQYRF